MKQRNERLLTAKEAASYLGISLPTLARIEKRGDLLPYRTLGGHRRYSIEMLEEYLENSRCNRSQGQGKADKEGLDE